MSVCSCAKNNHNNKNKSTNIKWRKKFKEMKRKKLCSSILKSILNENEKTKKKNKKLLYFIGDLFDMLLPMLSIYQEYVRNHHYSLQVLTECKQSSPSFAALLARLENKTACQSRSLETFLTYPMHQVI